MVDGIDTPIPADGEELGRRQPRQAQEEAAGEDLVVPGRHHLVEDVRAPGDGVQDVLLLQLGRVLLLRVRGVQVVSLVWNRKGKQIENIPTIT